MVCEFKPVKKKSGLLLFTVSFAGAGLWFSNAPVGLWAWTIRLFKALILLLLLPLLSRPSTL